MQHSPCFVHCVSHVRLTIFVSHSVSHVRVSTVTLSLCFYMWSHRISICWSLLFVLTQFHMWILHCLTCEYTGLFCCCFSRYISHVNSLSFTVSHVNTLGYSAAAFLAIFHMWTHLVSHVRKLTVLRLHLIFTREVVNHFRHPSF
jgi:hypothetical protein